MLEGLSATRPFERVEIDEHEFDLVAFMDSLGWVGQMIDKQRAKLSRKGGGAQSWATIGLCARTRCVGGFSMSPNPNSAAALGTLQMILTDKGKWSDGVRATCHWNQYGIPETIATDCGSALKSDVFRTTCAEMGITVERMRAGHAEMRARGERFFGTLTVGLSGRLAGKTFGSVFAKGDADPRATAAMKIEEVFFILVRWIVAVYHNTPHKGLGGETPAACWKRLSQEFGTPSSPNMTRMRMCLGSRLTRKATKFGIVILGVRYHSSALADHMMRRNDRDVEVRWHPADIGTVAVRLGDDWHPVPAVFEGFDGVNADNWRTAVKGVRAGQHAAKEIDLRIALEALEAIKATNDAARLLAGITADEWPEWRIAEAEGRYMAGVT